MVEAADSAVPAEFDLSGKSVYHGAYFLIYRLHVLLSECNEMSRKGDFLGWKRTLDAVYRELVWKMKVEDRAERDRIIKEVVLPELKAFIAAATRGSQPASSIGDGAYTALADYEIFLRDVQGKYGMMMPSTDDPRFAFRKGKG